VQPSESTSASHRNQNHHPAEIKLSISQVSITSHEISIPQGKGSVFGLKVQSAKSPTNIGKWPGAI